MLFTMRVDYLDRQDRRQGARRRSRACCADDPHTRASPRRSSRSAKTALRSSLLRGPRGRRHAALRPRQPARRVRAVRRRPGADQHHPRASSTKVTVDDVKAAAGTLVRAGQPHDDRQPPGRRSRSAPGRWRDERAARQVAAGHRRWLSARRRRRPARRRQAPAPPAAPAVGPERPFAPPPRVERTLANGLRVVVAPLRHGAEGVGCLTLRSGLAVDPAEKAGLAQFVADAAQEGTATRDQPAHPR